MSREETEMKIEVVLASASPRRKELLEQIGLDFQVLVSEVEEKITTHIPWELVQELSEQKAEAVMESLLKPDTEICRERLTQGDAAVCCGSVGQRETNACQESVPAEEGLADAGAETGVNKNAAGTQSGRALLVIGADTVVCADGKILGKPADEREAAEMLRMLQGRTHQVYTGVTLLYRKEDSAAFSQDSVIRKTFFEETEVEVSPMTEEEILSYVQTGEPMDKAGAYGIQGLFAKYVKGISGDYNNVVGLPAARVYQEAKEWL